MFFQWSRTSSIFEGVVNSGGALILPAVVKKTVLDNQKVENAGFYVNGLLSYGLSRVMFLLTQGENGLHKEQPSERFTRQWQGFCGMAQGSYFDLHVWFIYQ
ncbi:hypothetical protein [Bartonella australis]|uniref:hypothetical protein n=1 Tax=Bartonella australis TaxID=388640 RepID=UPI000348FE48|nr:hypothetical protein [Bartonella australis]